MPCRFSSAVQRPTHQAPRQSPSRSCRRSPAVGRADCPSVSRLVIIAAWATSLSLDCSGLVVDTAERGEVAALVPRHVVVGFQSRAAFRWRFTLASATDSSSRRVPIASVHESLQSFGRIRVWAGRCPTISAHSGARPSPGYGSAAWVSGACDPLSKGLLSASAPESSPQPGHPFTCRVVESSSSSAFRTSASPRSRT